MPLDDRKFLILQAIIDDYITTAMPVGSRTISRKSGVGFSPGSCSRSTWPWGIYCSVKDFLSIYNIAFICASCIMCGENWEILCKNILNPLNPSELCAIISFV